jgi:hypothetical protein
VDKAEGWSQYIAGDCSNPAIRGWKPRCQPVQSLWILIVHTHFDGCCVRLCDIGCFLSVFSPFDRFLTARTTNMSHLCTGIEPKPNTYMYLVYMHIHTHIYIYMCVCVCIQTHIHTPRSVCLFYSIEPGLWFSGFDGETWHEGGHWPHGLRLQCRRIGHFPSCRSVVRQVGPLSWGILVTSWLFLI